MKVMKVVIGVAAGINMCVGNVWAQQEQTTELKSKFVGVETCKTCHPEVYKDWADSRYAKAWKVIEMRGKTHDSECLACHTTGYGEPSGFESIETTPDLVGVQCEACHGPGEAHSLNPQDMAVRKGMKAYVHGENVCVKCHARMRTHRVIKF